MKKLGAKNALAALILAGIWIIPFCMPRHAPPLLNFWQEWWAATLVAVAFLIILASSKYLSAPRILIAPILMILLIGIQYSMGKFDLKDQWAIPALYLLLMVMAALCAATLRQNGWQDHLADSIAVASLLGSLLCVGMQWIQLAGMAKAYAPYVALHPAGTFWANIQQVNHLAAYLSLGLGGLFYFRLTGRVGGPVFLLSLISLTSGLVLTGQRSAAVYLLMVTAIHFVAGIVSGRSRTRVFLECMAAIAAFIFCFCCIHWASEGLANSKLNSFAKMSYHKDREIIYRYAWEIFKDNPLLGIGFSQFWMGYFTRIPSFGVNGFQVNAHNLPLMLLAETGLIGAAVIFVPLFHWIFRLRSAPKTAFFWLGAMQLTVIALHSLVEYPLWYSYWLIIAGVWLGALDEAAFRVSVWKERLFAYACFFVISIALIDSTFSYLRLQAIQQVYPDPNSDDVSRAEEFRSGPISKLSNHWLFASISSAWIASHVVTLDTVNVDEKLVFNTKAILARPEFVDLGLTRQIVFLVLKGNIKQAVDWAYVGAILIPHWEDRFPDELKSYSKQWPDQFNQETTRRLLSAYPKR